MVAIVNLSLNTLVWRLHLRLTRDVETSQTNGIVPIESEIFKCSKSDLRRPSEYNIPKNNIYLFLYVRRFIYYLLYGQKFLS